ncbi:putative quinol monooxygenase [Natronorubrum sp. FCH18a]|uniref:putative quinol monooxygenase n=1 Tax=Natronorubrum sp. FCH18a TaxID=3447018 RepID=UPI003F515F5E
MIVIHASFPIDPDRRETALEEISQLVEKSHAEDGVLTYQAMTDLQDPTIIRIFEQYEDETALKSHTMSAHLQAFQDTLPELLAGEPEVIRYEIENETPLEM